MLDAYLELGEIDMPVMIMPMPVPGSTGPASLFGNLSLANAEALSSIVIFQLAHPGRPLVYSSAVGSLDFSSGGYLGGTTEMGLQSAALAVMGRFYNLPSSCAGCTSDAMEPGPQAVMEKLITTLPPALAGADIIVGFGEIQSDQMLVLEQMIVDNEIAHYCQRMVEGIDISEGKALFEDIAQVGPGGHFLKTKGARQAPRSGEFYASKLMDRTSFEAWLNLGKPSMYSRAREQVRAILAAPPVDALPEEVNAKLDEILRRADETLEE
jgi:trimethylamine--corrinoid protein Co-methyltransferase